ncbi:MAG: response regulator [Chloroflexota bacterium]
MANHQILIVDDQKDVTRVLKSSLETLEMEMTIATVPSGEEAILELVRGDIDLLISDVRLPGISGLELLGKSKSLNQDMKVVLVSGVTDPKIRQRVAQAGADAFFFKPIDIPDFLDAVERALGMVDTILPPELHTHTEEPADEETEAVGLTEEIARLRDKLKASVVALIGDQGQILVRAGALPNNDIEKVVIPNIMPMLSSGFKISHYLNSAQPDHLFSFRGEAYDLFISPIGEAYALLISTDSQKPENMGEIARAVQNTSANVLGNLTSMGISTDSRDVPQTGTLKTKEPEPVVENLSDPALENLLMDKPKKTKKQTEEDAFWETAVAEEITAEFPSGDSLSYDQALQLGLAPSED